MTVQSDVKDFKDNIEKIFNNLDTIANIINKMPGFVKLDLIGGEVSLFDLHSLLESLFIKCGEKLKRINITTNMHKPVEYYNDLTNLCFKYNSEIGITCSWHSEYISMEDFFNKFIKIKSPTNQKGIRAEMVSRIDNREDVIKFIDFCTANNIAFFVEKDLTVEDSYRDELINTSSSKKKDRYNIILNDDSNVLLKTRNEFMVKEDNVFQAFFPTDGYYCTRDYNYTYIEIDLQKGSTKGKIDCKGFRHVSEFEPLDKPEKCVRHSCSLCGHMSVSKDISLILEKDGGDK